MTPVTSSSNGQMKGLVLSGGAGTRLRPITHTSAKQLVPVANKPVLFYGLESMRDAGIRDVGIIVGDTEDEIRDAVGDGSAFDLRVEYIRQDAPRGLAHAVLTAEDYLDGSPFLMYLGDNLLRDGLKDLVQRFDEQRPDAMILLTEVDDPSSYGVAELNGSEVVRLVEKPKDPPSNLALVGAYIFTPSIFDASRAIEPSWRGELEITDAIQHLIDSGMTVSHDRVVGWWKDTGKLEDMLHANRLILDRIETRLDGEIADDVRIEGRVVVEPGAKLRNCRVRGPVVIGADTVVEDAYIGPYTAVYWGCRIENAEVEHSIILEQTTVSDVDRRMVDSLLGKDVRVTGNDRSGTPSVQLMVGDSSLVRL